MHDSHTHTHTCTFILAACTLFPCRCEGHPPGPFHEALPFLSSAAVLSASITAAAGRHRTAGVEGKRLRTHLSLIEEQERSGWGRKKGSSSFASPSAFIVNNLLSVCDGAVLPLVPLPSLSDAQMGFTRKRRRRRRGKRMAGLPVRWSDAELLFVAHEWHV